MNVLQLHATRPGMDSGYRVFETTRFERPYSPKAIWSVNWHFYGSSLSLEADLNQVRVAFGVIGECRRLPVMMEVFLGETIYLSCCLVPEERRGHAKEPALDHPRSGRVHGSL
jgi:hypothetical protein